MAFTNSKTFLYNAHILKSFFEDLDRWREECACFGIRSTIEDQQYDDLFKGTDADVYIPMWASACKGHGDILIDRTTYDCIRFYKAYGYEAIHMDGNPADFLGEQLRFLEYISVCGLKGTGNASLVIEAFIEQFTLDTVKEFCKSLRAQNAVPISEELGFVCEALEALVRLHSTAGSGARNRLFPSRSRISCALPGSTTAAATASSRSGARKAACWISPPIRRSTAYS